MTKGWIVVGIMLVLSMIAAESRIPAVGDGVLIYDSITGIRFEGNITDMDENAICLNCTGGSRVYQDGNTQPISTGYPYDICFSKSQITLMWPTYF